MGKKKNKGKAAQPAQHSTEDVPSPLQEKQVDGDVTEETVQEQGVDVADPEPAAASSASEEDQRDDDSAAAAGDDGSDDALPEQDAEKEADDGAAAAAAAAPDAEQSAEEPAAATVAGEPTSPETAAADKGKERTTYADPVPVADVVETDEELARRLQAEEDANAQQERHRHAGAPPSDRPPFVTVDGASVYLDGESKLCVRPTFGATAILVDQWGTIIPIDGSGRTTMALVASAPYFTQANFGPQAQSGAYPAPYPPPVQPAPQAPSTAQVSAASSAPAPAASTTEQPAPSAQHPILPRELIVPQPTVQPVHLLRARAEIAAFKFGCSADVKPTAVADAQMPEAMGAASAAYARDPTKIFFFGGKGKHATMNGLFVLDSTSMELSAVDAQGEAPTPRAFHSMVGWSDYMIVFGGSASGIFGEQPLNDAYRFHVPTSTWTKLVTSGAAPRTREYHSAVVLDGHMYVYAGASFAGRCLSDLHVLDLVTLEWRALGTTMPPGSSADAPVARYGHTASLVGRHMLVLGGKLGSLSYDYTLLILDLDTLAWVHVREVPGLKRAFHTATVVGTKIIVVAGCDKYACRSDVHAIDATTAAVVAVPPQEAKNVPVARYMHSAVRIGNDVLIYGGRSTYSALRFGPSLRSDLCVVRADWDGR